MSNVSFYQDESERAVIFASDNTNAALLKALAKDGGERFVSCTEFIAALGGAEIKPQRVDNESRNGAQRNDGRPQPAAPGVESLMKRGHLFLEDSDWKQANCDENNPYGTSTKGQSLEKTSEVGLYPANAWGLFDMHGNVGEWCLDWYWNYPDGAVTDPVGASSGSTRVLRGGYVGFSSEFCRSAFRGSDDPSCRLISFGVRLSLARVE